MSDPMTPEETPVEQRLRERSARYMAGDPDINAGREAIALWRAYLAAVDAPQTGDIALGRAAARALLARCEEMR